MVVVTFLPVCKYKSAFYQSDTLLHMLDKDLLRAAHITSRFEEISVLVGAIFSSPLCHSFDDILEICRIILRPFQPSCREIDLVENPRFTKDASGELFVFVDAVTSGHAEPG
jgi:hypothetical protein